MYEFWGPQCLLLVLANFEYVLNWICIFLCASSTYLLFHWFYMQKWDMQIIVKNTNFSAICEVLNFCSWSLLIFNIFIIGSQIETTPLLPRRRVYRRRQKSSEKRWKYVYFAYVRFFRVALRLCCVFVSKRLLKIILWAPL